MLVTLHKTKSPNPQILRQVSLPELPHADPQTNNDQQRKHQDIPQEVSLAKHQYLWLVIIENIEVISERYGAPQLGEEEKQVKEKSDGCTRIPGFRSCFAKNGDQQGISKDQRDQ